MKIRNMLFLGAAGLSFAMPTYAQSEAGAADDAAIAESYAGDVIIVEARRRDESVQDVPSVVNAVTSEDLEKLSIRDFKDVETLVPGLSLNSESNGIGGNAQLRGLKFDINTGAAATVSFYLNDAPSNADVILQQTYDVGQIEVLRGPQGTLRGLASPSGSITVTTKKPSLYDVGGYVSATGTDIGGINMNGAIGVPIVEGVLGVRVAGLYDVNEGNRVKPIDADVDARDPRSRTASGRASVVFQPLDWLKFEGMYQHIDRSARSFTQYQTFPSAAARADLAAQSLPDIDAEDRRSIWDRPQAFTQKYNIYNWRAEAVQAGQKLIYQGQRSVSKLSSLGPLDYGDFFTDFDTVQNSYTKSTGTSHEIRLQNDERVADMFDYVVGFFTGKGGVDIALTREDAVTLFGNVVALPVTNIAVQAPAKETSFFGNLTWHIGDNTELSGGVRHINYKAKDGGTFITFPGGAGGLARLDPERDENEWIYTASIKHNFTDDLMVYASTGTSWRPPLAPVGVFAGVFPGTEQYLTVEAEESQSYEIGLKSTLFDNRVRFNVSGFYQEFENYPYRPSTGVYYVSINGPAPSDQRVDEFNFVTGVPVEIYGIEAELGWEINDNWDLNVLAAYAHGEIKNGTIACNDFDGDGNPDPRPATAADLLTLTNGAGIATCDVTQRSSDQPPFSATIQSEYGIPVSTSTEAYVRGLFNFYGKSKADPTVSYDDVDSFGLLNLFTGLRDADGGWELGLYAKNVFDTVKVRSQSARAATTYQALQPPTFTTTQGQTYTSPYNRIFSITPPREFGVSFRYTFGDR